MKYTSSASFRRALEDHLRNHSQQTGLPLVRLRKLVAFDRVLARLNGAEHGIWILKGGFALQLRLGALARTTKDIDLLMRTDPNQTYSALRQAVSLDLEDWFEFTIAPAQLNLPDQGADTYRFSVQALLDGRNFETFHVDIGLSDPVVEEADNLNTPALLEFAGIPPTVVPCYPLSQHIAEKVHAYTLPRTHSANSRLKDLVDILLLAGSATLSSESLHQALLATFNARQTHPLPQHWPDPPNSWGVQFSRLKQDYDLRYSSLEEAPLAARQFIEPILQNTPSNRWEPQQWQWLI